jgi:hypothetical protein
MLYNELEQGDSLSGVRWRLALLAYTDILLCSIWAIRRIRQTPDGIYYVEFQSSLSAVGYGLAVLSNGSINGGDFGYIYQGRMNNTGNNISTRIQVSRYNSNAQSVFGSIDNFSLDLAGSIRQNGSEFSLSGAIPGQPQLRISITGRKLRDLV